MNQRYSKLNTAQSLLLAIAFFGTSGAAFADIKVGITVPSTGFAAADGKSALDGAKLAVAQANAKGGIKGEKIELVVYDDQASPKEAVPAATKLVEKDKVVAAIGGSYSGATRASASVFQAAQVPYAVAYAIHPDITKTGDFMFRVSAMGEVQGRAGAKLVNDLGKKKVALINIKNDFGQSLAAGFKEGVAKFGLTIVGEHEYSLQDRQFGPLVAAVKSQNPEVIYASGYFYTAGPLVNQLRAAGVTATIIGQEGYDSDKFIEIAGPASEGVLVTTSLDRDSANPATKAFLADYKAAYNTGADMVAASTYTAAQVVIDGLNKTGGKGGAALRDAMAAGTYDSPIGKLSFNDLHEVKKDIQVQIVKDKAFRRHSIISDAVLLAPPSKSSK
jgi:branched-chain amino acid transport system substrate-binding protein